MHFKYIPYIWPLTGSALVSLSLGVYSLIRQRNTKCAKSFILSMFVVTIWSVGNAFEMAATDFSTKLFWANVQYISYCYSPVTLLTLCMEFTGYDKLIRNKKIFLNLTAWVLRIWAVLLKNTVYRGQAAVLYVGVDLFA